MQPWSALRRGRQWLRSFWPEDSYCSTLQIRCELLSKQCDCGQLFSTALPPHLPVPSSISWNLARYSPSGLKVTIRKAKCFVSKEEMSVVQGPSHYLHSKSEASLGYLSSCLKQNKTSQMKKNYHYYKLLKRDYKESCSLVGNVRYPAL